MRRPSLRFQLLAASLSVLIAHPLLGGPAPVFNVAQPVINSDAPASRDLNAGDASVASKTGAFTYSYPITVAPGRGKATPKLALTYSSQGSVYGGIAAGWSLSIPSIYADSEQSELHVRMAHYPREYRSSLSGGHRLIPVSETTDSDVVQAYRARFDDSYVRYEQLGSGGQPSGVWRARTLDGTVHWFGESSHWNGSTGLVGFEPFGVARLTRSVDVHGNTVEYFYEPVVIWNHTVDWRLERIDYSTHEGESLAAHARIKFQYSVKTCSGSDAAVGAQSVYRAGEHHQQGASQLDKVTVEVNDSAWEPRRQLTLGYKASDQSCTERHAPLRVLESITESAKSPEGIWESMPAVTFGYESPEPPEFQDRSGEFSLGSINAFNYGESSADTPGPWPEVHGMMLDFDGDGLLDRLVSYPGCQFMWEKNTGSGFTGGQLVPFPTVPAWSSDPLHCTLTGQHTAKKNVTYKPKKDAPCSEESHQGSYLAYRFVDVSGDSLPDLVTAIHYDKTWYSLEDDINGDPLAKLGFEIPACPPDPQQCADPTDECMEGAVQCSSDVCRLDYDQVERCICDAPTVECTSFMEQENPQGGVSCPYDLQPHAVECSGTQNFVWVVYENTGGALSTTPKPLLSPIPLESYTGSAPLSGSAWVGWTGSEHGFMDLDGDDFPDAFVQDGAEHWQVYRGQWDSGTGKFGLAGHTNTCLPGQSQPTLRTGFMWRTPAGATPGLSQTGDTGTGDDRFAAGLSTLVDVNADGKPDLVYGNGGTHQTVHLNEGYQFQTPTPTNDDPRRLANAATSDPVYSNSYSYIDAPTTDNRNGTGTVTLRFTDYDADGRPDFARVTGALNELHVNPGTAPLLAPRSFPASFVAGLQTRTVMALGVWEVENELIDLNGDGLLDLVDFSAGTFSERTTSSGEPPSPPRLMTWADNGRGYRTEVSYVAHSTADSTVVEKSSGSRLPKSLWLVDKVTRNKGQGQLPSIVTSYVYKDAVWNRLDGEWGFRGFESVETYHGEGAGAKKLSHLDYSYFPDRSGRLSETQSFLDDGSALRVARTTWEEKSLWGDRSESYVPSVVETYHCAQGESVSTCKTRAPQTTITTWSMLTDPATGEDGAWASTEVERRAADTSQDGDRKVVRAYELDSRVHAAADTRYRLRLMSETRFERQGGQDVIVGKSENEWSSDGRNVDAKLAYPDQEHLDPDCPDPQNCPDPQPFRTELTYDATGNVLTLKKPKQVASGSSTHTVTIYDSYKLYPVSVTVDVDALVDPDSPDRTTQYATDLATGQTLVVEGPNPDQKTVTTIDGFGRPIATEVLVDSPGGGTTLEQITESIYDDPNNKVTNRARIEYGGGFLIQSQTTTDGLGRVIETEDVLASGTNPVHTYSYDDRGQLDIYTAPHPGDDGQVVTYQYDWDLAGRVTLITMPGNDETIAYDYKGWDDTLGVFVTEVQESLASAPTTQFAKKQTHQDVFGRLIAVRELRTMTPAEEWAETTYTFDGNDNVQTIVDAENVTTTLTHDWLGRRTQIDRGGRIWSYIYDENGNLLTEVSPHPSGMSGLYTTSTCYDELDRPVDREVGARTLSEPEQTELAIGHTELFYDQGANGLGRLSRVDLPEGVVHIAYTYNARGRVTKEERGFQLPNSGGFTFSDGTCTASIGESCENSDDCGDCAPTCGDGTCDSDWGEDCGSCSEDCGACSQVCGNGVCEEEYQENCSNCSADCGSCTSGATLCGNGTCETWDRENCYSCPDDCFSPPYCPASVPLSTCGNGTCDPGSREDCESCPTDCGSCTGFCGSGVCAANQGEDCRTCGIDCGSCQTSPDTCGNGTCSEEYGQDCSDCSADCGSCSSSMGGICGDGVCDPVLGESCQNCSDCGACITVADTRTIEYQYNALGVARILHPDGDSPTTRTITKHEWDERGLPDRALEEIGAGTIELSDLERNIAGSVTSRWADDKDQEATWSYDAFGRILEHKVRTLPGTPVTHAHQVFGYEPFGDVALQTVTVGTSTHQIAYTHDLRHQLTDANNSPGLFGTTLTYGLAGRLTSADVANPSGVPFGSRSVDYEYDPAHPEAVAVLRDQSSGTVVASYQHDDAGNVTQRSEGGQSWTFLYDGDDIQRKVTGPGGESEAYFYDHDGQRMLSVRRGSGGGIQQVRFFFAGTEIQYDSQGQVTRSETTVVHGQPVARIERMPSGDSMHYLFHSPLDHLLVATDDFGNLQAGFVYGPFGEIIEEIGAVGGFLRRFNDKYFDEVSSLSYYGARYYDALSLTWSQADPLYSFVPDLTKFSFNPRRANLYTFSLNNPMRFVDPDGLDAEGESFTDKVRPLQGWVCSGSSNIGGCLIATDAALHNLEIGARLGEIALTRDKTELLESFTRYASARTEARLSFAEAKRLLDELFAGKLVPRAGTISSDGEISDRTLNRAELIAFVRRFLLPMRSTRLGQLIAERVRDGSVMIGVILGRHGRNETRRLNEQRSLVAVLIDETAEALKNVPDAYPDVLLVHELVHVLRPDFVEPDVRLIENNYRRWERGLRVRTDTWSH